jgi:hypothetical protein
VHHLDLAHDLSLGAVSLAVGTRPEVHARAWAAHGWWLLGDERRWRDACAESVSDAQKADHAYSLVVALAYAAISYQMAGDVARLEPTVAELTNQCDRHGFAYYSEWALVVGGWLHGGESGIRDIRRGVARLVAERSRSRLPYWLSLLADLQHSVGRDDDARATLDAARIAAVLRKDVWWLPEVLRARAMLEPTAPQVLMLREADKLAAAQSSPGLQVRIRADLDRLGSVAARTHAPSVRSPDAPR